MEAISAETMCNKEGWDQLSNKRPMGCDVQLTRMQTGRWKWLRALSRRNVWGQTVWGTVQGMSREIVLVNCTRECLRGNVWGIIQENVGGMSGKLYGECPGKLSQKSVRGNVWEEMSGELSKGMLGECLANCPGNVQGNCSGELSEGVSKKNVWGIIQGNVRGMSGGNVRRECLAKCPRNIQGNCPGELSEGMSERKCLGNYPRKCWGNVWRECLANCTGMSRPPCRSTSLYVQQLWFVTPWLTHRYTERQLLTGYYSYNYNHDNVYGAVVMTWSLREFTRFIWWMQTERRVAANPQTKPTDLGCESAERLAATIRRHHRHLLLLSS